MYSRVDVDINPADNRLSEKDKLFDDRAGELTDELNTIYKNHLSMEAPIGETGDLAGGHIAELISPYEGLIYSDIFYAPYVIHGTDPHIIRPKKKKGLFWKGAAHPYAMVNHPGTKPNPYPDRAVDNAEADKDEAVTRFINWLEE